ncbi:hypothetical protein QUF70_04100 [Desulfobacterales bacterium HSG17]|nr:hypothetical protein [Desulfobacterales bacterium HSG17]
MEIKNGSDYSQNYDIIVKWIAEALKGQSLEIIGVKSGCIEEVFGFEPVDIAVTSGRVDVMARDDAGEFFHIEEQRNLRKSDMYRFAAYHFLSARKWEKGLTDIILASGKVYAGKKTIKTKSGEYSPIVVDFSLRDGKKRLKEIQEAVKQGNFTDWLELIFLPLYGKEAGVERSETVEQIIRFETELFHENKISSRLVAATLIMSNKLIDKKRLKEMWEDIKMLDIIEIAREKGVVEGKSLGIVEGKSLGIMEAFQEMLTDALIEKFSMITPHVSEKIINIKDRNVLKGLFRQVFKCSDIQEFENILNRVCSSEIC